MKVLKRVGETANPRAKKHKHARFFTALAIAPLLALTACAAEDAPAAPGSDEPGETQDTDTLSVVYSVEALDETQTNIAAQIKRRAAELTEAGEISVEATIYSADDDVDRQNNDIDSAVTRKADAIIVTCIDPAGCVGALERAHDEGLKIVDVRGNIESEKMDVLYKGLDEPRMGELLYERAKAHLEENPEVTLNFGLIMGGQTFTTTHARVEGIKKLAEEMPDRVKILVEDYGDWKTEDAATLMEDWTIRYPEMNALASSSDEMALGAVNVLKSKSLLDDYYILSVNASDNGLRMVEDGEIEATVGIDFAAYGMGMVDAAIASIKGELSLGEEYDVSDEVLTVVDLSNFEAYAEKKAKDEEAAANY